MMYSMKLVSNTVGGDMGIQVVFASKSLYFARFLAANIAMIGRDPMNFNVQEKVRICEG